MRTDEKPNKTASPPRQARSLASYTRMLDAAEKLLPTRTFEELTIADIVRESRTSVGVFYSRFGDKEALLDALYDRHQREVEEKLAQWDSPHWDSVPVETLVRARVAHLIELYRGAPGLYRTLVLRGHQKPDARYAESQTRNRLAVARFGKSMRAHADEIAHPDPERAGSLAYLAVIAALREKLLFGGSTAKAIQMSDRELENELVAMTLAYLQVREQA